MLSSNLLAGLASSPDALCTLPELPGCIRIAWRLSRSNAQEALAWCLFMFISGVSRLEDLERQGWGLEKRNSPRLGWP